MVVSFLLGSSGSPSKMPDRGSLIPPRPTSAVASSVMKGNRRRDTQPELALRKAMHKRGLRYRVDFPVAAGSRRVRPDAVFTRQRVAVFLDGFSGIAARTTGSRRAANSDYWAPKLARNVERDREVDAALGLGGWMVIRIWEHEDAEAAAERIEIAVRQAQPNRGLRSFEWVG